MGEAKRQRDAQFEVALKHHLDVMRDEGQGVWELEVIDCLAAAGAMLVALETNDEHAWKIAQAVQPVCDHFSGSAGEAPEPLLCLTCDAGFPRAGPPPAAFVILTPSSPLASHAVCNILCDACFWHP